MQLIEAIKRQVEQTPDARAVVSQGRSLTYAELWKASVELASNLGDIQNSAVCLQLPNSVEYVVWLLAVWQGGGVAVPVDTEAPRGLIESIKEKTRPSYWIESEGATVSKTLLKDGASYPSELANICFTSGSTGAPKAVMQSTSGIAYFAQHFAEKLRIKPGMHVSWLYQPAFSATFMDILGCLISGATLFAYDLRKMGIHHCSEWLKSSNIQILHTVPSVFRVLVQRNDAKKIFESVVSVDLGGEPVLDSDISNWLPIKSADAILFNHLAATEASVIAMQAVHTTQDLSQGWTEFAVDVAIVDGDGSPTDTTGRIRLSSPYLSPGYVNPTPVQLAAFSSEASEKTIHFITEDLARWENDSLRLEGRIGRRVKLNGLAIDLDEIEALLIQHPLVKEAAVVQHDLLGKKPVAWLVPSTERIDFKSLKEHLAHHLPPYAIPLKWEILPEMPLNPNGKRDLFKLQSKPFSPEVQCGLQGKSDYEVLISKWFVQEIPTLSANPEPTANFFEIGGDSLAWGGLHARMEKSCGAEIPIHSMLKDPTVRGLGQILKDAHLGRMSSQIDQVLVQIREGDGLPLFIIHGGYGEAFLSPAFADLVDSNRPIFAFRALGMDWNQIQNIQTVRQWAQIYLDELLRVQPTGPYSICSLCIGYTLALNIADLLEKAGETVLPIALFDPPFQINETWREQYVRMKRWVLFKVFGKKQLASRNVGFTNGLAHEMDDNAFSIRTHKIQKFYRLYRTFDASDLLITNQGCCFSAGATVRKRAPIGFAEWPRVIIGTKHEDVLKVNNPAFIKAWKEFEKESLNW